MELLGYIKELLLLNDCVVIPGFGGFVSSYKPAQVHSSRFFPPSKSISFNRKLNFNDGLFINHVSAKEGISYFTASKKINLLVQEMTYRLTDGEDIAIPGIGTLRYDDHENLLFIPEINGNLNIDSYGMPSFSYETLYTKSHPLKPSDPQEKNEAIQVIFQKRTLKKVMVALPLLFALAVIPLKNNNEHLQASSIGNIAEVVTSKEPAPKQEEVKSPVIEETAILKEGNEPHPYFVIGGSFKSIGNAETFISQMKEKGYSQAQNLGIIKGLHYIALNSFATFEEAKTAQDNFKQTTPGSGVWIYVKK